MFVKILFYDKSECHFKQSKLTGQLATSLTFWISSLELNWRFYHVHVLDQKFDAVIPHTCILNYEINHPVERFGLLPHIIKILFKSMRSSANLFHMFTFSACCDSLGTTHLISRDNKKENHFC